MGPLMPIPSRHPNERIVWVRPLLAMTKEVG